METNNTRKTNKNKNKKKKINYPSKQHNSKNTRIAGKTVFYIDWKQNKQQDKSENTNEKQQNTKKKPT